MEKLADSTDSKSVGTLYGRVGASPTSGTIFDRSNFLFKMASPLSSHSYKFEPCGFTLLSFGIVV